jgi:hypothetical protein
MGIGEDNNSFGINLIRKAITAACEARLDFRKLLGPSETYKVNV